MGPKSKRALEDIRDTIKMLVSAFAIAGCLAIPTGVGLWYAKHAYWNSRQQQPMSPNDHVDRAAPDQPNHFPGPERGSGPTFGSSEDLK